MARVTFTVPPGLKARIQARRDINWSAWVARILERRLDDLERWEAEEAASPVTHEQIDEPARRVDAGVGKRWRRASKALQERRASSSTRTG